jgi:hypothetical protein
VEIRSLAAQPERFAHHAGIRIFDGDATMSRIGAAGGNDMLRATYAPTQV